MSKGKKKSLRVIGRTAEAPIRDRVLHGILKFCGDDSSLAAHLGLTRGSVTGALRALVSMGVLAHRYVLVGNKVHAEMYRVTLTIKSTRGVRHFLVESLLDSIYRRECFQAEVDTERLFVQYAVVIRAGFGSGSDRLVIDVLVTGDRSYDYIGMAFSRMRIGHLYIKEVGLVSICPVSFCR